MNEPIQYPDLLALLSAEVGLSTEQLRQLILSGDAGVDKIELKIEQSNLPNLNITLASSLPNPEDGAPLLAGNVALSPRKLKSLLVRQAQHPEKPIGPVVLTSTEELIAHYREKIERRLNSLIEKVRSTTSDNLSKVHDRIVNAKDIAFVETYFTEIINNLTQTPTSIPIMMSSISTSVNNYCLTKAINTAFISMAVVSRCQTFEHEETRKATLTSVGGAALLQDISLMTGAANTSDEHPGQSSEIARAMGLDETVCQMIGQHHTVTSPTGNPVLELPESQDFATRALVAVNVFLDEVKDAKGASDFEIMKNLTYLADNGFIDAKAVETIGELCLPKIKSFVLERAVALGKYCPYPEAKPILWPIAGEKVPSIFLCPEERCENWSPQLTIIARDIPFEVDSVEITKIEKGEYHTCPMLSKKLKLFYQQLQQKLKRN
jgi:hypothetical protein